MSSYGERFGRLLRIRRGIEGLTQEALAVRAFGDPDRKSRISELENGKVNYPQQRTVDALAVALGITPDELEHCFTSSKGNAAADIAGHKLTAVPHMANSSTERKTPFARLDQSDNEVYMAALFSFRVADQQVGGGHLYATVVSYLHSTVASDLFATYSSVDRTALFAAAASLSEMAGWMAHEAGQNTASREHLVRACDLAELSGDRQLMAKVLASMSHLAYHLSNPEQAFILIKRGWESLTGGPRYPEVEALLYALEARGFAAMGKVSACIKRLKQAEAALEASPDEPSSRWVSRFDEGALANETARSLSLIGDLSAAGEQAQRIVALRPRERVRSRAFGQLLRASVLVAQGTLDEACEILHDVLASTRYLSSYPLAQQLARLRHHLEPYRNTKTGLKALARLDESLWERRWLYPGHAGDLYAGRATR